MKQLQLATLSVCALLFAAVVVAGWPDLVFALALEQSPLAGLQTMLLAACATAAAVCGTAARGRQGQGRAWAMVSLLLLAAALDDRFMGHEVVQAMLARLAGGGATAQRAAQLLTLLYIPVGVAAALWLRRALDPQAWRWSAWALGVGMAALAMDAAFTAAGPQVIEESLEYVAESLMLTGLLSEAHIRANRPH
jgi:hypothetical protein